MTELLRYIFAFLILQTLLLLLDFWHVPVKGFKAKGLLALSTFHHPTDLGVQIACICQIETKTVLEAQQTLQIDI